MDAHHLTLLSGEEKLKVPIIPGFSVRELLDQTPLRVRAACGGSGRCASCRVRLLAGEAPPLSRSEREKLPQTLQEEGWRLACQLRPQQSIILQLAQPAPPSPWRSLPPHELAWLRGRLPHRRNTPLAVAVDLGTTHLRLSLWQCQGGYRIASRWGANPQEIDGSDLLNRLAHATQSPERARQLADAVQNALLEAILDMLQRDVGGGRSHLAQIGRLVIVGNTAMLALLSEQGIDTLLQPEQWQQAIDCQPLDHNRWQQSWQLPHARIELIPPIAGFIGSDLLAGILATDLHNGPPGSLLLDFGTNLEMALWDGKQLHVTSLPGGPAFIEASSADWPGKIERLSEIPVTEPELDSSATTLSGYAPAGLIEAVAWLCREKHLKPSGRFALPVDRQGYRLHPALSASAVTAAAIDGLQRAKAACAAALQLLLEEAHLSWSQLHTLHLGGTLGQRLPLEAARQLGLLPPLPDAAIRKVANSALTGCEKVLFAAEGNELFAPLIAFLHPLNLATVPRFDDLFLAHLPLRPIPLDPLPAIG